MTKSDDKASQYAINVIERGTSATAHELDRLQAKLGHYQSALLRLSMAGNRSADKALHEGKKL